MNDKAIIPTKTTKESAGLDLYLSWFDKKSRYWNLYISSRKFLRVHKSSLASKGLLTLGEVIDKNYTGEIIVIMTSLIKTIKIKKGQKIAQLIVSNIMYPEIKKVESLKETERNNKGFGEMDKIDSIKKFSDEVFEYFNMHNYKI